MQIALQVILWAVPVLFSIVLHEFMHGYVADRLGDPTPRRHNRLTLNPINHIDPFGTVILPIMLIIVSKGTMVFGWAKPVPINPMMTLNPKRTMGLTALAGPATNFALACICTFLLAIIMRLGPLLAPFAAVLKPIIILISGGLTINVVLTVINLIPIPPLDGGRVLVWLLPDDMAEKVAQIEPYGMFIVFGFFMLDPGHVIGRLVGAVLSLFTWFIF